MVVRQVDVRQPPPLPDRQPVGVSTWLLVLPAIGAFAALVLIFTAGGTGLYLVAGVLFGVCALAMIGGQLARAGGDRPRRIDRNRADYLRHLAQIRRQARSAAAQQAQALFWLHPEPSGLQSLVRTSRLWERRPTDPDFASIRLGLGDQALALDLRFDGRPADRPTDRPGSGDVDIVTAVALRRLLRAHRTVRGLPVAVSLRSFARIHIEGNLVAGRAMATAMTLQAIAWHAPTEFRVALCARGDGLVAWDWLKWAPHLADPALAPTDLPRFAFADNLRSLTALLADDLAGRPWASAKSDLAVGRSHILVIVDGGAADGRGPLNDANGLVGVTVIDLSNALAVQPTSRSLRLRVVDGDVLAVTEDPAGRQVSSHVGTPDQVGPAEAAATCRAIAALRLPDDGDVDHSLTSSTGWADLVGVPNIRALTPNVTWRPRPADDLLRVPIGVGATGQTVELDLKDGDQGGMGPHGLIVGATGSGKSELLRTIVLGLAITHPPDLLNFVLVDLQGDATFDQLDGLPHTSAVITDRTDEPGMVDRLTAAIAGELDRRRELLRSAGNFASLRDYNQARALGWAELPALPALLIVVDEFRDALTATTGFRDLLIVIGRDGRALGVHLLLSAEQIADGQLGDLNPYLTYRIALRTGSVADSRIALGAPDAARLPTAPGNGYLVGDSTGLIRFKGAYVSGLVRQRSDGFDGHGWVHPQAFRLSRQPQTAPGSRTATDASAEPAFGEHGPGQTLLEVAVSQLSGTGVPAHEVWLPPLAEPPSLDLLLPRASVLTRPSPGAEHPPDQRPGPRPAAATPFLQVPLGWLDRPRDQTRDLLTVDLSGPAGHVAVVGASRSGKSTTLRSLICALALTHTPAEVQFYCLDFGGGSLTSLSGLPHIGAVAGRLQPDLVQRTVAMVSRLLDHRATTVAGAGTGDGFGEVLLVVDGWAAFTDSFGALEAQLTAIAARGLDFGIHLALTADYWTDIRPPEKDRIRTRIELRLEDPLESAVDPGLAAAVPKSRPGRGLSGDRFHLLAAVPRIDGRATVDGLPAATAELVRTVAARWSGPSAPAVAPSDGGPTR